MAPNSSPKTVSVIIPAWNAEATIQATLTSALRQTHTALDILLADDGSTDRTLSLARALADGDSRIRILPGDHRGHPGAVRNRALREASGEYVAFLDADDLWVATKLADQIDRLERSPGADLCSTSARFLMPGEPAPPLDLPSPEDKASPELRSLAGTPEEGFDLLLTRRRTIHTSSVLLSRSLVERIGAFSESPGLRSGQDDDFLFRAWRAGSPVSLPEVYVFALRRPESVSANNTWEVVFELVSRAEAREPLSPRLRRKAWSAAWTVRGERCLRAPGASWRRAMLEAWKLDPVNPRRLPALMAAGLPSPLARRVYFGLRELRRQAEGTDLDARG